MSATSPTDNVLEKVTVRGKASGFLQNVTVGKYQFHVDEPINIGGTASAPDPYDYLLAALGACTSMTVGLYARHKKIPLENITVSLRHYRIHAEDCENCETKVGMLDRIDLDLEFTGNLTAEQRAKLVEIAGKCPVHRTLTSEIDIRTRQVTSADQGQR
jgi:putative redox protein